MKAERRREIKSKKIIKEWRLRFLGDYYRKMLRSHGWRTKIKNQQINEAIEKVFTYKITLFETGENKKKIKNRKSNEPEFVDIINDQENAAATNLID